MRYNNKEIWLKAPRLSPKVTLDGQFEMHGKTKEAKWVTKPVARVIKHSYYLHTLAEVRELERFFLAHGGRQKSFFIPSHKRDFLVFEKAYAPVQIIKIKNTNALFWIYNQSRFIYAPSLGFATQVLDAKKDVSFENLVLKEPIGSDIELNLHLQELINVRFNADKLEIEKKGAVGYSCEVDFREVFYE